MQCPRWVQEHDLVVGCQDDDDDDDDDHDHDEGHGSNQGFKILALKGKEQAPSVAAPSLGAAAVGASCSWMGRRYGSSSGTICSTNAVRISHRK